MKNEIILQKMIKHIDKILEYTAGMDYNSFECNSMVVEASVFNLSQIGELANNIDRDFVQNHNEIPWRQIYGLRNRIVHDYDGVNLKLVWEIINNDLLELKDYLQSIQ